MAETPRRGAIIELEPRPGNVEYAVQGRFRVVEVTHHRGVGAVEGDLRCRALGVTALLVAAVFVLAACGGGGSTDPWTTSTASWFDKFTYDFNTNPASARPLCKDYRNYKDYGFTDAGYYQNLVATGLPDTSKNRQYVHAYIAWCKAHP